MPNPSERNLSYNFLEKISGCTRWYEDSVLEGSRINTACAKLILTNSDDDLFFGAICTSLDCHIWSPISQIYSNPGNYADLEVHFVQFSSVSAIMKLY